MSSFRDAESIRLRNRVGFIDEDNQLDITGTVDKKSSLLRKEVDTTDGTVIYNGWADIGAVTSGSVWRINRITISGSNITIEWADSNLNYDNIWTARSGLVYG